MANENMKNPFRLLLNILHRLLDDKADTEYVDQRIDEAGKDVSLGISEAGVGQTVKITEVDENGKPVKWQAVESSWNDLTDRPFYKIPGTVYLEPTEIDVTVGGNYTTVSVNIDPAVSAAALVDGNTLLLNWNDTQIPLTVELLEGRTIDWDNTTDWNNPVYKTYYYISQNIITSDGTVLIRWTNGGSITLEMQEVNIGTHPNGYPLVLGIREPDVIKTIGTEFLPPVDEYIPNLAEYLPSLPEYVDEQTDEQIMDARRKMGLYYSHDEHPVVAEDVYSRGPTGHAALKFYGLTADVLSALANLTQCRVSLDGVGVYDMDVQNISRYVSAGMVWDYLYWLGNGNLLNAVDGMFEYLDEITESKYPDVPFAVYYKPGGASEEQWGVVWDSTVVPATGDKIIIENLAMMETVVEPVPEEYIPETIARRSDVAQANWGQVYSEKPDYIQNKPFGEQLTASFTVTSKITGNANTDLNGSVLCNNPGEYTLYRNGEKLALTCKVTVTGMMTMMEATVEFYNFFGMVACSGSVSYSGTLTIEDNGSWFTAGQSYELWGVKQLDEKYIPDSIARETDIPEVVPSDWNQNDPEQPDYVKNRPFYSEDGEVLVIDNEEKSFYLNGYYDIEGYMYSGFEMSLTPGYPVTVILDGATYNTTVKELSNPDYSAPFYYCGNGALFGVDDEDTGMPFILFSCPDANALVLPLVGEPNFSGETHTVTIRCTTKKYTRVPPEYLPGLANETEYGFVKAAFTDSTYGFTECYITYDGKLYVKAQPVFKFSYIGGFDFPADVGQETVSYYDESSDIGVQLNAINVHSNTGHGVMHVYSDSERLCCMIIAYDGTGYGGTMCSQVVGGETGNIYHVLLKREDEEERYMLSVKRIM